MLTLISCRYDVALDINVIGAKHVLEFAKKCVRVEMLLHVSSGMSYQQIRSNALSVSKVE